MGMYDGMELAPDPVAAPAPQAPKSAPSMYAGMELAPDLPSDVPRPAKGMREGFIAGIQTTSGGLAWRQKLPDLIADPAHQDFWDGLATGAGQVVGSFPSLILGAKVGFAPGAAVGVAVGGPAAPLTGPMGGLFGMGAAGGAIEGLLRESLMEAYRSGEVRTKEEFWNEIRSAAGRILTESGTQGVAMMVGGPAMRFASKATGPLIGTVLEVPTQKAGSKAAALGGATGIIGGVGAAATVYAFPAIPAFLDERWPSWSEIGHSAIIIGGLHTALPVANKIANVFVKTGRTPAEQVLDAQKDPNIQEDFVGPPRPTLRWQDQLFREVANTKEMLAEIEGRPLQRPEDVAEITNLRAELAEKEAQLAAIPPEAVIEAELKQIYDSFYAKAIAAGEEPVVAAANASLVRTRADIASRQIGVSPLQVLPELGRPGYEIEKEGMVPRGVGFTVTSWNEALQMRITAEKSGAKVLPEVSRRLYEELEKTPPAEFGAKKERQLQELRARIFEKGQAPEIAMRDMWGPELADASPGLREAIARGLALQKASSGTTSTGTTPPAPAQPIEPAAAREYTTLLGKVLEIPDQAMGKLETVELPVKDLAISKDVPQFKAAANERGVVQPLGGEQYDKFGTPPVIVWERTDGRQEVISGRHRLDLAQRTGAETIPAQIVYEKNGFTAKHASLLDAALNIRDQQGTKTDFAVFFRANPNLTEEMARKAGLIARPEGREGFEIAQKASDELMDALKADQIDDKAAFTLAINQPNDAKTQMQGMMRLHEGHSLLDAVNWMQMYKDNAEGTRLARSQMSLSGIDEAPWELEAAAIAEAANKIQMAHAKLITATQSALRRPEEAAKMGITITDPERTKADLKAIVESRDKWKVFALHTDLLEEAREVAFGKKQIEDVMPKITMGGGGTMFQGVAELKNGVYDVGIQPKAEEPRRKKGDQDKTLDLFTETEASRKEKPQPSVIVETAKRGEIHIGFDGIIDTPEKAASAFASLRKSPFEKFQIIVTDDAGKPLAAYHLFAGSIAQAGVYPREVLSAVYMTPGAKKVWFAHNHPSGLEVPSEADLRLTKAISEGLGKDIGVEFVGHVIIAGKKARVFDNITSKFNDVTVDLGPTARTTAVPIMERVIKRQSYEDRPALQSPHAVREYVAKLGEAEPGLILLDSQNRPMGYWPIGAPEMIKLRTGDVTTGAGRVMEMVGRLNPAAAIAYIPQPGRPITQVAVRNLGALLNTMDVRLLDAFVGKPGELASYSEGGVNLVADRFFQAATVVERPDLQLIGETPSELKARNEEAYALAKRKLVEDKIAEGKPLEADQADLFNTQGTLFQTTQRKWYYSELARQVEASDLKSAPAAQWKATIKNMKGVKQAEIEATQLNEWLDARAEHGGKVTKEEISAYIAGNGLKVVDVTLGPEKEKTLQDPAIADDVRLLTENGFPPEVNPENPRDIAFTDVATKDFVSASDLRRWMTTGETAGAGNEVQNQVVEAAERVERYWRGGEIDGSTGEPLLPTHFASWQLPGGTNYREAFITMPENAPVRARLLEEKNEIGKRLKAGGGLIRRIGNEDQQYRKDIARYEEINGLLIDNYVEPWLDGHSPYSDIKNPIMRYRYNERTDADGKRVMFLEEVQQPIKTEFDKMPGYLQKHWLEMGMKRIVTYAIERGFDKVAWTTGAQQVERYTSALRHEVDTIEWTKTPEGVQLVGYKGIAGGRTAPSAIRRAADAALERNDNLGFDTMIEARQAVFEHRNDWATRWAVDAGSDRDAIQAYVDARTRSLTRDKVVDTRYSENELSDAIGKAMADRIRNDPAQTGVIEGENITIDKTWPSELYDRRMVKVANDILEKMGGGKVEDVNIRLPIASDTDFSKFKNVKDMTGEATQPGFDITPAMREKAQVPLFQDQEGKVITDEARGSYTVLKNLITLFKGSDRSTLLHELGHSWLEEMKALAAHRNATPQLKADWEIIRRELAIPESGEISTPSHEQFARGVERYVMEGRAPSVELEGVFARFRAWLVEIYKTVLGLNVEISPEMRGVFDRMLATEEQIAQAREMNIPRKYVPLANAEMATKIVPPPRKIEPGFAAEQASMQPFADELPPGPGRAPDTTHVNYAYINSPWDVKLAMQKMAEIDQAAIQRQRGGVEGVKSWEQANAEQAKYLNDILGGSEDTLRLLSERDPAAPGPDVKLGILKKLAVGAAKDSARLRDIVLEHGEDAAIREQLEYMGSIERARMIQAEFLGERASIARALNALKDVTEGSGEIAKMLDVIGYGEEAKLYQSAPRSQAQETAMLKAKLDEILLNYRGKTVLDIAKLHKEIGTLKGSFMFAKEVSKATTWDKVIEAWKAGLLSGPITPITNLFGTAAFQFMRPLVDATAAGIGILRGAKVGMGESDRASMMESVARLAGMVSGMQDALKIGWHALKVETDPTGKVEAYRHAIEGRAGEIIRFPFRLMAAGDAITTTMYERGELATLAMRKAFDEGLNPDTREFSERVQALKDKPPEDMVAAAHIAATRMAFNTEGGEKLRALQLLTNKAHLQWMLPFIRTPANIAKEMTRMSPFAPIVGEWRAAIVKGGIERDRAIAEVVLGSGIMALTMAYAFSGNISGAGDPDPGKRRAKAGTWQPYSIKIGDTWYEYARIQPMGTLMGMAADIAAVWDHMNDDERDKIPKMLATAFSNAITNQTFLQGITNVVNAISDPGRFSPQFGRQMAGSLVPNIIGQTTTITDPFVREVNGTIEAIQSRIPGARQELLPKRDWLGEPIETKERLGIVSPIRMTEISKDPVRLEADRLGISVAAAPKRTHIGKGTGKIGNVELTPEERDRFAEIGGKMAHEYLTEIVGSDIYKEQPDIIKRKIFRDVLTRSHKYAAAMTLPMDKRLAYIQEITEKMEQALQPAE